MMNSFFLLHEAIPHDFDRFRTGMAELIAIDKGATDNFMKHNSIYSLKAYFDLCYTQGQFEQNILKFLEQLATIENYIHSETEFDTMHPESWNAFIGIDFSQSAINKDRQVVDDISYKNFINRNLWNITYRTLWPRRDQLFTNLILCGEVEQQIINIGDSSHFNQIIDRLKVLDGAVGNWTDGDFSYREVNQKYSLKISPESDQTMNKYGNERLFSLPTGGRKYFELHIKTGDLRFHFLPDTSLRKVYVGYIGPHLSTVSN